MITYLKCRKGFSEIDEWSPECWVKCTPQPIATRK